MRVIQTTATVGPDGVLTLTAPADPGQYDIAVVLHPRAAAGTPEAPGWPPGFLEETFGSITDESFVAPPRSRPQPAPPADAG